MGTNKTQGTEDLQAVDERGIAIGELLKRYPSYRTNAPRNGPRHAGGAPISEIAALLGPIAGGEIFGP
jgi:hypothetical protein